MTVDILEQGYYQEREAPPGDNKPDNDGVGYSHLREQ